MLLRKLRWVSAGLVAAAGLLATPARSAAEIVVTVTELGAGGSTTVLGTGTVVGNTFSIGSGVSSSYSSISLSFGANSGATSATLSTAATLTPVSGLSLTNIPSIQISVASNGIALAGLAGNPATVTNSVGASTGILTTTGDYGASFASGTTLLQSPPGTLVPGSTTPTSSATATTPGNAFTGPLLQSTIGSLPATFSIIQDLTITPQAPPAGSATIDSATLTGTISSTVAADKTNPVPAPGGLVLAALAVPAFGLRRLVRRKPAAE